MTEMNVTRRNLLAAAGLGAAAAVAAPASAAGTPAQALPKWTMETDVVVLGAGGAGLMAACQVADKGGKVVVFDKSVSPYHSATRMCGGLYTAYGSSIQKRENAKDSWQEFAHDIIDYGSYMSLREPVELFAKYSGEAFDFLENNGLAPHHLEKYAGHSNLRAIRQDSYQGKDYIDVLVAQIKKRGIEVFGATPLTKIYYDQASNTVLGIQAKNIDTGKVYEVRAKKGVIMCTGGITGTPASLDFWVPSVAGKGVSIGCTANDGSAMRIAVRDVGVPLSHMQYIASYPCGVVVNGRNGPYCRFWYFTNGGGILINKNGKRFINEREGICHITPHLAGNPDGCHYAFMDERVWKETTAKYKIGALFGLPSWNMERVEEELALGQNLWKCATLEELCQKSGINLANLKAQLADWNKSVAAKSDAQCGRPDMASLKPLSEQGPYYMVRMFPWNNLSCGGMRVTSQLEVLGWDLKPVKGLYAAGETVAGVHGAYYCGGNACGFAHTSGYMAGQIIMGRKA
ncbi:MAG: FAD-dependent oxidoreductase [Duodenibacillus sp.]|nr:FAD-dependent oxidoreductase [Duodenibacillus sp.]